MEFSPPQSPMAGQHARPSLSMQFRSNSRMSITSKPGSTAPGSRASDEDSKTAVKVAIRVRPLLQPSNPGYDLIPPRFRASTCQVTSPTNLSIQSAQGKKLFVFDRVFGQDVEQAGVWDYLSDSIKSFVQGYNVSILAYGQSGAGKSYTMGTSGSEEQTDSSLRGVVPRAATALFELLAASTVPKSGIRSPQRYSTHGLPTMSSFNKIADSDREWQLKATYVEIYNEQLRDLLIPESTAQNERAQVSIREDTKGRILLTGLTHITINSVEDLLDALNFGSSIRQTDSTAINAKSSRSHAVFSLNLVQKRTGASPTSRQERRLSAPIDSMMQNENVVTLDSKLHFVDLAGSERLKNTGAQGDRAKEGISINAGLASLGKVISQLSSRHPGAHVSYRDSRLTRLLQDSIGGNAITYMVACITPAEFHLSETLNTVHYAQRARAIQSRPEIQQTTNEADKAALIERLQAEVAFLRDQISHERTDQRASTALDRSGGRKEVDLQNQLLDIQENYSLLSQRHARLIAEITNAKSLTPALEDEHGDAEDRLRRSSSFAEAVESVVLEYEKTIQSLESNLSYTRSSLSNSESALMEREAKMAHMESAAQQLQRRLQKMSERESNSDSYLQELENQMEGATSNEEKSNLLVQGLRKELSRTKENESSSEEYISTLEERLAEAEQDHDIMQREIDRLEQVVERQRSIGRLDNLLAELNGIRQGETQRVKKDSVQAMKTNGIQPHGDDPFVESSHDSHERDESPPSPLEHGQRLTVASAGINRELHDRSPVSPIDDEPKGLGVTVPTTQDDSSDLIKEYTAKMSSQTAQSNFMADKLETLTQELFDLKGEHEATRNDHDELQRKYTIALETLAKLQDSNIETSSGDTEDETPAASESFLADAGVNGVEEDGQSPSSRSLHADLSSHQALVELTQDTFRPKLKTATSYGTTSEAAQIPLPTDRGTQGAPDPLFMQILKKSHAEKSVIIQELRDSYAQLSESNEDAMNQIEDLKVELKRAQAARTTSPQVIIPMVRRKPSQNIMSSFGNVDHANRSFASLRNIALDNFEDNPDLRQNFEMQLNTIMTELHNRSEKMQSLEAELATVRRDMDSKTTIIAGLTRERSSLKAATNVDFSIVGQMRDQLMESEQQIRSLHETHASTEAKLQTQIKTLQGQLEQHRVALGFIQPKQSKPSAPSGHSLWPVPEQRQSRGVDSPQSVSGAAKDSEETSRMQQELSAWEAKHNAAMDSMKTSEQRLLATISELELSLQSAQEAHSRRQSRAGEFNDDDTAALEEERAHHQGIVASMQQEIENYKTAGQQHSEKLSKLEEAHANILLQVEEDSKSRELTRQQLQTKTDLVRNLENQIELHKSTIQVHEQDLDILKSSHASKVEELQTSIALTDKQADERYNALQDQHGRALASMEAEVKKHQEEVMVLLAGAAAALGHKTDSTALQSHIEDLVRDRSEAENKIVQLSNEMKELEDEARDANASLSDLQKRLGDTKMLLEESKLNLAKVTDRQRKSSRLVQELEDQISNNFDSHQAANHRLSTMQGERQLQLLEAVHAKGELEKELEDSRLKISLLESQLVEYRRRSATSTVRESHHFNRDSLSPEAAAIALARSNSSASAARKSMPAMGTTALPSPPPAIPLPPLPGSPGAASPPMSNGLGLDARAVSPLTVRPDSPQANGPLVASPDPAMSKLVEEQEARIRTIEKHLFAEKQLTATLEEALVDIETAQNRTRGEMDAWRKKCNNLEDQLIGMHKDRSDSRASVQAVEEEREMRVRAERARMALEERMRGLEATKKKKKGVAATLNCF